MRKFVEYPRNVHTLRLNDQEYELVQKIGEKYMCKSFSDCIRMLIQREADRIENTNTHKAGRKLTSW